MGREGEEGRPGAGKGKTEWEKTGVRRRKEGRGKGEEGRVGREVGCEESSYRKGKGRRGGDWGDEEKGRVGNGRGKEVRVGGMRKVGEGS